MTRALTRTNFHSSRLVRILSDLALVAPVEPGNAFAHKLGQWVSITDAITLHAAHSTSPAAKPAKTSAITRTTIGEEFARVRASLEESMTKRGSPKVGKTQISSPNAEVPIDLAPNFEPYRRAYLAHQRDMELCVRPLRSKVRNVLAKASPTLKQLADLDAALDTSLSERESRLLSAIPALLEHRFEQLFKIHQQRLAESEQADHPDFWMKPGGWLARFCHELQTVLLAELDARLQPTQGLIEALHHEKTTSL